MTVCVAAISDNTIFGAADQMITAGDIQFQPSRPKVIPLTTSIVAMTAGDAAFQAEIFSAVHFDIAERLRAEPDRWLTVQQVVDAYVRNRSLLKNKQIEERILLPLGLTYSTWLTQQQSLSPALVNDLAREMLAFQVPRCSTIFCGVDESGAHIFTVEDGAVYCNDPIGFAAIGSGARHAESHFMLEAHSRNSSFTEALFRTYAAKRRAELAPGVGDQTDMFMIGSRLGSYTVIGTHVVAAVEKAFAKLVVKEKRALGEAHTGVKKFVEEITTATGNEKVPSPSSGQASVDEPTASRPDS